jgi:hypothetical protein
MDAYTAAFNAQDSEAASRLFTDDGTYKWDEHQDPEEVAEMSYEVIAVTPEVGVARWIASHTNEREWQRHRMDGVFVVTLTADGLCDSFREWWNTRDEAL